MTTNKDVIRVLQNGNYSNKKDLGKYSSAYFLGEDEIPISIHFDLSPGSPATRMDPPEEAEIIINYVLVKAFTDDAAINEIKEFDIIDILDQNTIDILEGVCWEHLEVLQEDTCDYDDLYWKNYEDV